MENRKIAQFFAEIADILDIQGENPFRIRSYRNAARQIEDLTDNLAALAAAGGDLTRLSGIGTSIADKIKEIAATGHLQFLDELKKKLPPGLPELLRIEGLGPKKVKLFYDRLAIDTLDQLEAAARAHKLRDLPGMGEKSEEKLLHAIENFRPGAGRYRLDVGFTYAESIAGYLKEVPGLQALVPAGSLRRRRETIGDLDILAICREGAPLMDAFVKYDDAEEVIAHGTTKSSLRLTGGLQVDVRVLEEKSFGAALLYFTGSQDHNIALRKLAQAKGLKVSEYGVFSSSGEETMLAGKTEEECYRVLGLAWIPPELRENRGEIEAAARGKLPDLVDLKDIRGDLQMHTTATDGKNSIAEMAAAAKKLGYEYIALTDHSQAVKVAGGLNEKELARHLKEIDRVREAVDGIAILRGVEVDILADGSLDLKDEILRECDVVVASVHYRFNLPEKEMTKRIVTALKNKYVNILGHPTGRLLLEREPYQVKIEEVIRAAVSEGVTLEINAHPSRLDLNDVHARMAHEMGAQLAINTDAHADSQLALMKYGVFTARRAWLEKKDLINTRPLQELRRMLAARR